MHRTTDRQLRSLLAVGTAAGLPDDQLLERFVTRGAEAAEQAFAALMERHGPMVLRVCRSYLRGPQDVEDAFQATFLILVRRAASIRRPASVGPWLYGVARRVSCRARAGAAMRLARDRDHARGLAMAAAPATEDAGALIHEELVRLPERHRRPIVLCDLEGMPYEEAAERLGWPVGTVKSRLSRGRQQLRRRLELRGLAPAAAVTFVGTAAGAARGAVPAALAEATISAATRFAANPGAPWGVSPPCASLTEGVLKAMFLSKIKAVAGVFLALGIAAGGAGVFAQQPGPGRGPADAGAGVPTEMKPATSPEPGGARRRPGWRSWNARSSKSPESSTAGRRTGLGRAPVHRRCLAARTSPGRPTMASATRPCRCLAARTSPGRPSIAPRSA